eukprot:scaffold22199_cov118-Isochrysis_galbana.AAC.2
MGPGRCQAHRSRLGCVRYTWRIRGGGGREGQTAAVAIASAPAVGLRQPAARSAILGMRGIARLGPRFGGG